MRWLLLLLIILSPSAFSYWDCHWPFRTEVTINNSNATPTDYQVLVDIQGANLHPGYNWSNAGEDLRVLDADDNTELKFWIDNWNQATRTASVWVRFPSLSAGSRNIYFYYGNQNASPITQVPPVFTYPGIRFHTRRTPAPANYSQAVTNFNSAADSSGYGCKFIENFTEISNQSEFSSSGRNFMARSESFFEVKPGESGNWEFRYGADFGGGGALLINNSPLEEQWGEDLWWARDWRRTGPPLNPGFPDDILIGSVNLTAGYHKLEVIGWEGCCDGGITVQFKKPGGNWQTFTTSNIDIRSAACPIQTTITFGAHEVCEADLEVIGFGSSNTNSQAPDLWVQGSPREVIIRSRNNGADPSLPNTRMDITLASSLSLDSYNGNGWSCSGSIGTINCTYSTAISSGNSFPELSLQVEPRSSSPNPASITAEIKGQQYDPTANNTQNISLPVRSLLFPANLPSGCSAKPGLVAGFFNTSGSKNFATSSSDFQSSFVTPYENGSTLFGYTVRPNVSSATGSNNNPFGSGDKYLTIFEGYIYLDRDGDYRFAVDGDDAVELSLFDSTNPPQIAAWYGGHGENGSPRTTSPATIINTGYARGYYRFRYLHQENSGGDGYRAYWQKPGDTTYSIIPASQFVNCTVQQNIQLESTSSVISDPINSANFKAIPGAEVQYTVTAKNLGNINTDQNTTILEQTINTDSEFLVGSLQFIDGSGNQSSGLNMGNVTVTYMDASGTSITPANGYTTTVRRIRMQFNGTFKAKFDTLEPEFSYQYQVRLQ